MPSLAVGGNGSQWQMVVNTFKSRLGGLGVGGLMEGEPRQSSQAWNTYYSWIMNGAQVIKAVSPLFILYFFLFQYDLFYIFLNNVLPYFSLLTMFFFSFLTLAGCG